MNNPKLIQLKEDTQTLIKTSQALQQEHFALRATLKTNMNVLQTSFAALKAINHS